MSSKTTSLEQLKQGHPPSMQQPSFSDTTGEPVATPLEEDMQNEYQGQPQMGEQDTMNNIIHHFETLQDGQQQQPQYYPSEEVNQNGEYPYYGVESQMQSAGQCQRPSRIRIILRSMLLWVCLAILLIVFMSNPVQNLLKKYLGRFYHVSGNWELKGILIFAIVLASIQTLLSFLFSRL
jgi:hypothetical protein